jgi:hypothetical protein
MAATETQRGQAAGIAFLRPWRHATKDHFVEGVRREGLTLEQWPARRDR